MAAVSALAYASVGWRALAYQENALPFEMQGIDLEVIGTVVSLPQRHADGWRFRFEVSQAVLQGSTVKVDIPALLQLGWYTYDKSGQQALPAIRAGQVWRLPLRLKQPHGLVNPGGFDMELWFWQQGIHALASVRTSAHSSEPVLLGQSGEWGMVHWRQWARDGIQQSVSEVRWAAIVSALLVGDQSGLDRADWDVFRATGVAHLMSISGLHITLWAWVARWLIQRLWRYSDLWGRSWCLWLPAPHAAQWGGLLLATLYAVFSGWGVPSQRTVAMLATFCVLHYQALRWPLPSDYDKLLPPNARSCVLRIHAQGQTMLLAADIEVMQERALVERLGDALRADILLVPHHGSKTSSTHAFLNAVQPRIAWVQAGYRNRYGHPAPEVMQRYADKGIPVWDSPRCGAMHWRSEQPNEVQCERDLQRRYWHHRMP